MARFFFFLLGPHPDIPLDVPEAKTAEGEGEQAKKRRGRKKSKLEDMFPTYLQEAFFGKTLLDQSKRAFLAPPTPRHTQGLLRPPLPGLGAKNAASEPGNTLSVLLFVRYAIEDMPLVKLDMP